MMKKTLTIIFALAMLCATSFAQNGREDYIRRYNGLVKNVGPTGVGIETLLLRWENDFPDDVDMLLGKFAYYYNKSQSVEIVQKDAARYLGTKPTLVLKDSLGADVNYFQEIFYDDSLFAISSASVDRAIKLAPERLELRLERMTALLNYEKESPDMTTASLKALIDYDGTSHPQWTYYGESVEDEDFIGFVQDFCHSFYEIGTDTAFESFRSISEKMLTYHKDNALFMNNLGTYYLIHKRDSKQALKYYNKVLKKHPDDYTAIKNCVLLSRQDGNVKQEKKYLPMLIENAQSDSERLTSEARLKALSQK